MHFVEVINLSNPLKPAIHAGVCDNFYLKLRGLMFYPSLSSSEGLLFIEKEDTKINSSIHMFFMRFDISVIWFNHEMQVVDKALAKKWHPYYAPSHPACYTLETHASRLDHFAVGDTISLQND